MYENMLEIHDKIKENPFRIDFETNIRYYKGYFDLLYKLEEMFYELCKEAKKNNTNIQLASVPMDFFHDFRAAITSSKISAYWIDRDDYESIQEMGIDKEKQIDREIIIERAREIEFGLSAIHFFIETGRFDFFYAWERKEYHRFEWDEDLQKYKML